MLKDCIVTMNINGIPQSFSLRGVPDSLDDNIQEILFNEIKNQTFSNTPYGNLAKDIFDFYNKTLPKQEIEGSESPKTGEEVLPENSTTNFSSIEKGEIQYEFNDFLNEYNSIKPSVDLINSEIKSAINSIYFPRIKLIPSTDELQRSNYDSKNQKINIYYDPDLKIKDYNIKRQFLHEYVHFLFSMELSTDSFQTEEGKGLAKELIEVIKNTKKGNKKVFKDFNENQNELYQVNEYLAEYYTGLVLNELDRNDKIFEATKKLAGELLPFYTELVKNDFISNEDEISSIIKKFKYGSKNDFFGKETQDVLKKVYESKEINTKDYGVEDTYNKRIQRQDKDDFSFNLGLSHLTTFDLIKVPWEYKGKTGEKWMPIIYQYFDKNKNQRIFKVADKLSGGENKGKYVYQDISDDDILAYSQNIGLIDNSNIKKPNLKKIRESFDDSISFNSSRNTAGDIPGILNIDTKKGKQTVNKQYLYLPINPQSDLSIENVLRTSAQGDIVKYKIKDKNLHGPIYRVLANTVEIINKEGNLFTIPFRNIEAVIVKKSSFFDDLSLDSTTINNEIESLKFDNKGLAYSNFVFTNNIGEFKKIKGESLYDYNQIFNNNLESKREEFNRFIGYIVSKKNKEESVDSYIQKNKKDLNPNMIKYYQVYKNRSNLLSNINNANTYISYDYIGNDGNRYSGKGKVISITNDTVKVFTPKKDGSEGFIQTLNIRDNIAIENHPSIRRIIYDNQDSYKLAKFFASQKQIIKNGYNTIIDKNKSIGDRKTAFKQFISNNNLDSILELSNTDGIPTSLSDFYYYDYLDSELIEELDDVEKNKYIINSLSKITPGCIVFQSSEFGNIPSIVTDIDKDGTIYTGDIISSENKYNGNYVRKKLNTDKLTAIGYNIKEIENIKPNEYYKSVLKGVFKNLTDSRSPKVFKTKEAAEKWIPYNKGSQVSKLIKLENKETKQTKLFPEYSYNKLSKESKDKYNILNFEGYTVMLNFDGEYSSLKNINAYTYRFDKNDSKHDKAFSLIEIGDLITYKGSNYDIPITLVVTNKLKNKDGSFKYKVESFSNNGTKIMQMVLSKYNYENISYIKYQNTKTKRMEENQDVFTGISKSYIEKHKYNPARYSKSTNDYNKLYDSFIKVEAFSKALEDELGVKFTILDSDEISVIFDNENNIFSDKRAFVYNGEIVLNSDLASLADPLHELTHVILGEMKINNLGEYASLINNVLTHPDYDKIAKHYPELSGLDLNEEVFSTIFGEYYGSKIRNNESQEWNNKNQSWFKRIINKIKSFFGKLFNVDIESFDMSDNLFVNMSINEIMDNFGGNIINNTYKDYINTYQEKYNKNIDNIANRFKKDELIKEKCYE